MVTSYNADYITIYYTFMFNPTGYNRLIPVVIILNFTTTRCSTSEEGHRNMALLFYCITLLFINNMNNNKDGKQVKNSSLDAMKSIIGSYLNEEEKASIIEAIMLTSEHVGVKPQVEKLLKSISDALDEFNGSVEDKKVADQLVAGVTTMVTFTLPLGPARYVSAKNAEMARAFMVKKSTNAGLAGLLEVMAELMKNKKGNE